MTPKAMARLHRAAFIQERPWSAREFADLLESPLVTLFAQAEGFALARTVAQETELLTLAVDPQAQRRGIGRALTARWLRDSTGQAEIAFLEVAADNHPAIALYTELGFERTGRRPGYYARKDAAAVDAIMMQRRLAPASSGDSHASSPESA